MLLRFRIDPPFPHGPPVEPNPSHAVTSFGLLQVTGICQDKSLVVGDPIFRSRFSLAQSYFPLHSRCVTF